MKIVKRYLSREKVPLKQDRENPYNTDTRSKTVGRAALVARVYDESLVS